jgi:hypothetical protein
MKLRSGLPWQNNIQQEEHDTSHQPGGLKFRKETSNMPQLEHSSLRCWNLDTLESRSEIPGKLWNVVLEKDGEDQLDRSREERRSVTKSQGGEEHCTNNTKMED